MTEILNFLKGDYLKMTFNKKQKICSILLSAGFGLMIFTPVSALPFI